MFNVVFGVIFLIIAVGGFFFAIFSGNIFGGIAGAALFTIGGILYIRSGLKNMRRKAAMKAAGIEEKKNEPKPEGYVDPKYNHMGMMKF